MEPIEEIDVPSGHFRDIKLHDGSIVRLETLSEEHDPFDSVAALSAMHEAEVAKKHVTGLLYIDPSRPTLVEDLKLSETALVDLPHDLLRPAPEALEELLAEFRA